MRVNASFESPLRKDRGLLVPAALSAALESGVISREELAPASLPRAAQEPHMKERHGHRTDPPSGHALSQRLRAKGGGSAHSRTRSCVWVNHSRTFMHPEDSPPLEPSLEPLVPSLLICALSSDFCTRLYTSDIISSTALPPLRMGTPADSQASTAPHGSFSLRAGTNQASLEAFDC